ncbi:hypothetical protein D9M69_624510 [compost metagenome]
MSGGTLSTAILMPSQVVPQLMQTMRNRSALTSPDNQCDFVVARLVADSKIDMISMHPIC